MKTKTILGITLVPALILLVPLVAMQFSAEVTWSAFDFISAWVVMAGAGFAYKLVTGKSDNVSYRIAAGLAVATALVLVWINGAVGLIGSEDNPANMMYGGVLIVGLIGAALARLRPQGMARTLLAMALAQFFVPVIALLIWRPDFSPGVVKVFILNAFFVMLFTGSALLFLQAARQANGAGGATTA